MFCDAIIKKKKKTKSDRPSAGRPDEFMTVNIVEVTTAFW